jgi:hypothetical protein
VVADAFREKAGGRYTAGSSCDCRLDLSGAIAIYTKPSLAWLMRV